ncbi:putative Uncharacterized 50.6 kDa protein in the 5'region of gyrA and gyrB [Nocardioides sp. AX2bis]|nr:putative Uncharacterized 50.6 kDa protein in the 5'region of gyrA and gyrB [Nocardioides sp. AX2bis]
MGRLGRAAGREPRDRRRPAREVHRGEDHPRDRGGRRRWRGGRRRGGDQRQALLHARGRDRDREGARVRRAGLLHDRADLRQRARRLQARQRQAAPVGAQGRPGGRGPRVLPRGGRQALPPGLPRRLRLVGRGDLGGARLRRGEDERRHRHAVRLHPARGRPHAGQLRGCAQGRRRGRQQEAVRPPRLGQGRRGRDDRPRRRGLREPARVRSLDRLSPPEGLPVGRAVIHLPGPDGRPPAHPPPAGPGRGRARGLHPRRRGAPPPGLADGVGRAGRGGARRRRRRRHRVRLLARGLPPLAGHAAPQRLEGQRPGAVGARAEPRVPALPGDAGRGRPRDRRDPGVGALLDVPARLQPRGVRRAARRRLTLPIAGRL